MIGRTLSLLLVGGYLSAMLAQRPLIASQTMAPIRATPPPSLPAGTRYLYKMIEGQQLSLFVLSPPPSPQKTNHPAILFFHGGGFVGGPLNQFDRQAQYFAGRGLVAIQVQYRLEDEAGTDSITPSLQDAASAMRWVRAHAVTLSVDPNRIGSAGGSAGGLLAAFVGMMDSKNDVRNDRSVSNRADIMVLFNPVLDMGPGTCCTKHAGADFKALSPLYFVRPGLPPTLVLQGESDKTVSPTMISGFVDSMKQAGNDCSLNLYPDVGHGFFNFGENFYKTVEQMDVFLGSHGWLKGLPDNQAIRKLSPSMN